MPNFKGKKDKSERKSTFTDEDKVLEETAPKEEEVKLRRKSQQTVQSRMSNVFKRFSMGTLNMDISRVKGKDSRYRSSESLESYTSTKSGSGQGSCDNLDKRHSGSRDSSISGQNHSQNHSRCNSIDELDESIYDTVDIGKDSGLSKKQTGCGDNETSAVSPRLNNMRDKPRPQSSIELGREQSEESTVSHNDLGYALVEKKGDKMVSKEDEVDNSKGIYLLAGAVPCREGSVKIKEEYSEPKDKRPDGAPLELGWDKPDDSYRDYREPCDSLTDSSKMLESSMEEPQEEEQVYEEIDLGGGHKASVKKFRPLLRSDAETKDDVDSNEDEKYYEEIPERNPLQRHPSNPYHSIAEQKSQVDPYDTIKDLTRTDITDEAPDLPPKPDFEPPYENSPRVHIRHKELPPLPDHESNPDQPPPVPPRNPSTVSDDHSPGPPPRPPKAPYLDRSFEKKHRTSDNSPKGSMYSDEDDEDLWDDDEWSDEDVEREEIDGENEEGEEEEIYANIKVREHLRFLRPQV